MGTNIIENIEHIFPNLSKKQKQIAVSIIQDPLSSSFSSIKEMSEKIGVSPASIVRFAKQVTQGGYPQLQEALQAYIQTVSDPIRRLELNLSSSSKNEDFLAQIIETQLTNLHKTINSQLLASINQAVDMLTKADRIFTLGSRGSFSVAYYIGHHLNRVFANTEIIEDNDRVSDFLLRATNRDVAFMVCLPRHSYRLLTVAKHLSSLGTRIITINSSPRSPFVALSDISLYVLYRSNDFHNSVLSSMLVAEMIISSTISGNMPRALSNLDKIEQVFQDIHQFDESK